MYFIFDMFCLFSSSLKSILTMDALIYYNDILANEVNLDFVRGLNDAINWNQKMI